MFKFLGLGLIAAAVALGVWVFGPEVYLKVAGVFCLIAGGLLMRVEMDSADKLTMGEAGYIILFTLVIGLTWAGLPVTVVLGWLGGESHDSSDEDSDSLEGSSSVRRRGARG